MRKNTVYMMIFIITFTLHGLAQNWADSARLLHDPQLCDIRQNINHCKCHLATPEQENNAQTLGIRVALEIQKLEQLERQSGRELKVVLLARSGTSLNKMMTYSDYDSSGKLQPFSEFIDSLLVQTPYDEANPSKYILDWNAAVRRETKNRKLNFSHISIALKNDPKSLGFGNWQLRHLLYSCADNGSSVYREGLGQFFIDGMKNYSAQLIVLPQNIQNKIENILLQKNMAYNFLTEHYNAAALYDDERQQNSNSWVLEVLAAAMAEERDSVVDRKSAIQYLKNTGYMGTKLRPTGLYSLMNFPGASLVLPKTMCLAAQPAAQAYAMAEVVTVLSIEEYLSRQNALVRKSEVSINATDEDHSEKTMIRCERTE